MWWLVNLFLKTRIVTRIAEDKWKNSADRDNSAYKSLKAAVYKMIKLCFILEHVTFKHISHVSHRDPPRSATWCFQAVLPVLLTSESAGHYFENTALGRRE
jgi:hypothetical protein